MEKNKKSDGKEEKKNAPNQPEEADADSNDGVPAEEKKSPSMIEEAREEREKMEKAKADLKAENDRTERLMAEREFGGRAGMSPPEKPKVLSDVEYAENLQKGLSNPLKEDGFIK